MNNVGLLTSTSKEVIKAEKIKEQLALMVEAQDRLPLVCFRADNAQETSSILDEILSEKELISKKQSDLIPVREISSLLSQLSGSLQNKPPGNAPGP